MTGTEDPTRAELDLEERLCLGQSPRARARYRADLAWLRWRLAQRLRRQSEVEWMWAVAWDAKANGEQS